MVTIWDEGGVADSLELARSLRATGLRVDVYPEADKLGKQFKFAASRGIPYVAVIGEAEKAAGKVALKDMLSGGQESLTTEELVAKIRKAH